MYIPHYPGFSRTGLSLVLGFCLILTMPLTAAEATADEQAVWKLEEQYWLYVGSSDIDGYLTLWDDRFVGWPSFSDAPVGKSAISGWIRPLHADAGQKFEYTLEQKAVRSFGEVVVAHYLVKERWVSVTSGGETRSETARITHTWKKKGDTWVIVTGMSCTQ